MIVCHACDLAHRFDKIASAARVRCVRCRAEIYRTSAASIDTVIALAASALVLFILANAYPLIALKVNGTTRVATLAGAVLGLFSQGYATMAVLVAFTAVLVPLFQILAFLYVLVALRLRLRVPGQGADDFGGFGRQGDQGLGSVARRSHGRAHGRNGVAQFWRAKLGGFQGLSLLAA